MRIRKSYSINNPLLFCLLISGFLTLGQYFNIKILIIISFLLITLLIIFTNLQKKISVVYFFIPWALILKLSPTSFSFFTFLVPLVILNYILSSKILLKFKKINLFNICLLLSFSFWRLIFCRIDVQIINFIINLIILLIISNNSKKLLDLDSIISCFSTGVLSSGICSLILRNQPHIYAFFNSTKGLDELRRFTGMNYDPNYFATQVLISLSLLVISMYYSKKNNLKIVQLMSCIILVMLGGMTISKTYMLILAFLILYILFIVKINIIKKLKYILYFCIFTIFAINTPLFNQIAYQYTQRLTVSNLNDLTTGRSDLIVTYSSEIMESVSSLLFGKGISGYPIMEIGTGTHNTYIELIFHFGILGLVLLFIFIFYLIRTINESKKLTLNSINLLVILVIVISAFSLQFLFMNEVAFYLLIIISIGSYGENIILKDKESLVIR